MFDKLKSQRSAEWGVYGITDSDSTAGYGGRAPCRRPQPRLRASRHAAPFHHSDHKVMLAQRRPTRTDGRQQMTPVLAEPGSCRGTAASARPGHRLSPVRRGGVRGSCSRDARPSQAGPGREGVERDELPPSVGDRFAWIAARARRPRRETSSQFRVISGGRIVPCGGDCELADGQVVVMRGWPAGGKSGVDIALQAAQTHQLGGDRRAGRC
jgi:hypothetical protein